MPPTELALIESDGRTTSLVIAERFGKRHQHVLRDIRDLECSPEFRQSNFGQSSYLDDQGKPQPCYRITRDGFMLLAMGFTGSEAAFWKERFISAWNAMEKELSGRREFDARLLLEISKGIERTTAIVAETQLLLAADVGVVKRDVAEHGEAITAIRGDVAELKTAVVTLVGRKRVHLSQETKDTHSAVVRAMHCRCPYCREPMLMWQYDHFYTVQKADLPNTWPLCIKCHDAVTRGKVHRTPDMQPAFESYQEYARRILPKQERLF